jgi:hypothetical protein
MDQSHDDLLDRTDALLPRQPLVCAIEPLGKAHAVGEMRLKHLGDLAQDPVDLLLLDGRLSTRARLAAARSHARLGPDRHSAERNPDPAEQKQLKHWRFAWNQRLESDQRFGRDKGLELRRRDRP